jgi:hypothetical protein
MKKEELIAYKEKILSMSVDEYISYKRKLDCVNQIKNGSKARRNSGILTAFRLTNKIVNGYFNMIKIDGKGLRGTRVDLFNLSSKYFLKNSDFDNRTKKWVEDNYPSARDVHTLAFSNFPIDNFNESFKLQLEKYVSNYHFNVGSGYWRLRNGFLLFKASEINRIDNFRKMEYDILKYSDINDIIVVNDKLYIKSTAK